MTFELAVGIVRAIYCVVAAPTLSIEQRMAEIQNRYYVIAGLRRTRQAVQVRPGHRPETAVVRVSSLSTRAEAGG